MKISDLKGRMFVKDMKIVLKDMEPYVRSVKPLWNGRDFKNFSLRAREIWSLWLLCSIFNQMGKTDLIFGEDDESDGILVDKLTRDVIRVENVAAMDFPNTSLAEGEDRIINAILDKASNGEEYAKDKLLVVFFDGAGQYFPNEVAKAIHGKHHFERIYLIGLLDDKCGAEYSYI